jgi:hypothetical protein
MAIRECDTPIFKFVFTLCLRCWLHPKFTWGYFVGPITQIKLTNGPSWVGGLFHTME